LGRSKTKVMLLSLADQRKHKPAKAGLGLARCDIGGAAAWMRSDSAAWEGGKIFGAHSETEAATSYGAAVPVGAELAHKKIMISH